MLTLPKGIRGCRCIREPCESGEEYWVSFFLRFNCNNRGASIGENFEGARGGQTISQTNKNMKLKYINTTTKKRYDKNLLNKWQTARATTHSLSKQRQIRVRTMNQQGRWVDTFYSIYFFFLCFILENLITKSIYLIIFSL